MSHNKSPAVEGQIPQYQSDQVQSLKVRYLVKDASADVVSVTFELPVFPFALSTSNIALSAPLKACRLSRIRLWTNYRDGVGISGNTHSVNCLERRGVRPFELSQTATYQTPACFDKKFDRDTTLGWFYSTTSGESNPEINFRLTKGSVLELTFDYVLDDGDPVVTAVGAGLTYPRLYTNSISADLDCVGKSYIYPFLV